MDYKYYILTILRNGKYESFITDANLVMFMLVEKELGHEIHIINAIEITKQEYDYYTQYK